VTNQIERNYLEIKSLSNLVEAKKPLDNLLLQKVDPPDFQLNKFFYKEIGKKHRWVDRLVWSDKNWNDYLNTAGISTFILKYDKDLVGFFEQIYHKNNFETEIAFFGILEEYIGKKLGSYLLSEAIKKSFEFGSKRVWVHTCSLDHKNALSNYISRGMQIYKTETVKI
tara:strand:+ start:210 stop:713 length:504 start_codon:yes stop_codon:yes gene_type:complete